MKPSAILKKLKLAMPIDVTVEDPLTRQPIVVAYENLHSLLVVDIQRLDLESQVLANLYAEMARIEHAFEYEAARAEGKYRAWRSKMQDECREKAKEEGKKRPTNAQAEDYYRNHPDYDEMVNRGKRFEALSGFFGDLKWAFKMKSEHVADSRKAVAGYERTARNEDGEQERITDYENLATQANEIANTSGSQQALGDLLAGKSKTKAPRALD